MKTIWLTSVASSEDMAKKIMSQLKSAGLEVQGHFWEDDLEKVAWMKARDELLNPKIALWGILSSHEDMLNPTIRYGLSLLTITVQAKRGLHFPIVLLQTEGDPIVPDTLTTPLRGADVYSALDPRFGAKLVAKVHKPAGELSSDYRLDTYGNVHIGQWFEVGPHDTTWQGAMFGLAGAEITFHAVGPKGKLPSQSVLNYPMKGLKVTLGGIEYVAWATQNELDPGNSYFIKVEGFPESVIFSPYSTDKETEVYVMKLK